MKNHKSAWAALATLGVTAIAAGATAVVKIRNKRKEREQEERERTTSRLTAEQMMVYNEAVSAFLSLNDRIYELRRHRQALQPLIRRLAAGREKPGVEGLDDDLRQLALDIERFCATQVPFINASLANIDDGEGLTYADCVHAPVGGTFDAALDEEPTGADAQEGSPVSIVLRLGYYFPESTIAPRPVKSLVLL